MKSMILPLTVLCALAVHQPSGYAQTVPEKSLMRQAVDRFKANDKGARIIGGTPAKWQENKWQVALVYATDPNNRRAQFCGGSIIAPGWVLTAAHCIDRNYPASDYAVLSGTDTLLNGGQRSRVTEYIVHEGWRVSGNKSQYDNDIALLRISPSPALIGSPIPLVAADTVLDNLDVLVTGWGVTEFRPTGTELLQQVTVPSVTEEVCNSGVAYNGDVTGNMFCAGAYQKDSCQGDSGGPATSVIRGQRRQVGVVSWGIGCGEKNKYGVYTRLPLYVGWIAGKTNGAVK